MLMRRSWPTNTPAALGRDVLEVWHEIRARPLAHRRGCLCRAGPVHMDDIELRMERPRLPEENALAFS
jgi:hypothetical protein